MTIGSEGEFKMRMAFPSNAWWRGSYFPGPHWRNSVLSSAPMTGEAATIAPTFKSTLAHPSIRRPMLGANESSTDEWHSAHVIPRLVSWPAFTVPLTPTTASRRMSSTVTAGSSRFTSSARSAAMIDSGSASTSIFSPRPSASTGFSCCTTWCICSTSVQSLSSPNVSNRKIAWPVMTPRSGPCACSGTLGAVGAGRGAAWGLNQPASVRAMATTYTMETAPIACIVFSFASTPRRPFTDGAVLPDAQRAGHRRMKGACVLQPAGVRHRMAPRSAGWNRPGVERGVRRRRGMRHEVLVDPDHGVSLRDGETGGREFHAGHRHGVRAASRAGPGRGQGLLQTLRVFEMRDEGRTDFHQQGLQLGVRRAGDQERVEGVDDLLVVGVFVVDVRLLERGAVRRADAVQRLVVVRLA